jgi:hypothetical protein
MVSDRSIIDMNVFGKEITGREALANFLAIFWPPMFIFALHVCLFRLWNAYFWIPWIDIPMHFLGGLSMAYSLSAILSLLQDLRVISRLDLGVQLLLVFSSVVTIAVLWEFMEFSQDHIFNMNTQISLANTMQDLLMGMLGAVALVSIKTISMQKSSK